jgi:hypothetical protein
MTRRGRTGGHRAPGNMGPSNERPAFAGTRCCFFSFGLCLLDRHDLPWLPPSSRYRGYGVARWACQAQGRTYILYKRSDDVTLVLDNGIVTLGPIHNESSDTDKQRRINNGHRGGEVVVVVIFFILTFFNVAWLDWRGRHHRCAPWGPSRSWCRSNQNNRPETCQDKRTPWPRRRHKGGSNTCSSIRGLGR